MREFSMACRAEFFRSGEAYVVYGWAILSAECSVTVWPLPEHPSAIIICQSIAKTPGVAVGKRASPSNAESNSDGGPKP